MHMEKLCLCDEEWQMSDLSVLYEFVVSDFKKFIGNGVYMALLFLVVVYLLRQKKGNQAFLVWVPITVLLVFFNPITILLIYRQFMWGTYWRILWLVPLIPVLAYAAVELISRRKKLAERVLIFAVICCIIVGGGRLMYSKERFSPRENFFKIPTAAIDIAQHIILYAGCWYPTVIVPNELYCYIRQFSSEIRLLYGRDAEGYMGGVTEEIEEIYQEMSKEQPDCEFIGERAQQYGVNIVIFNSKFHQLPEADLMKQYGLYYGGPVGDYIFYVLQYD